MQNKQQQQRENTVSSQMKSKLEDKMAYKNNNNL